MGLSSERNKICPSGAESESGKDNKITIYIHDQKARAAAVTMDIAAAEALLRLLTSLILPSIHRYIFSEALVMAAWGIPGPNCRCFAGEYNDSRPRPTNATGVIMDMTASVALLQVLFLVTRHSDDPSEH